LCEERSLCVSIHNSFGWQLKKPITSCDGLHAVANKEKTAGENLLLFYHAGILCVNLLGLSTLTPPSRACFNGRWNIRSFHNFNHPSSRGSEAGQPKGVPMNEDMRCVLYTCANEGDNPYDKHTQPKEHAAWHEAYWAVRLQCGSQNRVFDAAALKEGAECPCEQFQFALVWRPYRRSFRLRVNDVVPVDGRLGRVIRVTECAAVVLVNPPARDFKTRFDKPVRFQPSAVTVRIGANSEIEILNRKAPKKSNCARAEGRAA
jgi:hypothetical protein